MEPIGDVAANPGWKWSLAQGNATTLTASFTSGARTIEFTASIAPDGTIDAVVEEPIVPAADVPAGSTQQVEHDEHQDDEEHEDDEEHDTATTMTDLAVDAAIATVDDERKRRIEAQRRRSMPPPR